MFSSVRRVSRTVSEKAWMEAFSGRRLPRTSRPEAVRTTRFSVSKEVQAKPPIWRRRSRPLGLISRTTAPRVSTWAETRRTSSSFRPFMVARRAPLRVLLTGRPKERNSLSVLSRIFRQSPATDGMSISSLSSRSTYSISIFIIFSRSVPLSYFPEAGTRVLAKWQATNRPGSSSLSSGVFSLQTSCL